MRPRAVRILLGIAERPGNPLLRDPDLGGLGRLDHHARRTAAVLRKQEGPRIRPGAASGAASVHRRAGTAMRLLLQRRRHQGGRTALAEARSLRMGYPASHGWASLSLRDVSADHEGNPSCSRGDVKMTAIAPFGISRRDALQGAL